MICSYCKIQFDPVRGSKGLFCSLICQGEARSQAVWDTYISSPSPETYYKSGFQVRRAIRTKFLTQSNFRCDVCGWNKRNLMDNSSPLELDHIDGNWKNCNPSNIRVLCPNCHSLTSTYKNRNHGQGRNYRRLKPYDLDQNNNNEKEDDNDNDKKGPKHRYGS